MRAGTLAFYGSDILIAPQVRAVSGAVKQIEIAGGRSVFDNACIVELEITNLDDDQKPTAESGVYGMLVYCSSLDFMTRNARYVYELRSSSPAIPVTCEESFTNTTYLTFDATHLVSQDSAAPSLMQLVAVSGSEPAITFPDDRANKNQSSLTHGQGGACLSSPAMVASRFVSGSTPKPVLGGLAKGTLIETAKGRMPVESLSPGDRILTLDNGMVPIRGIGCRIAENHAPISAVSLPTGTMGNLRPLTVTPDYRILINSPLAETYCGDRQVFVEAFEVARAGKAETVQCDELTVYQILLDRHDVIFANGCGVESLFPSATVLSTLPADVRAALLRSDSPALLRTEDEHSTARYVAHAQEAEVLIWQADTNRPLAGSMGCRSALRLAS